MNWGRVETWHPNPAPFFEVGPMFDVGVYPLTVLTTNLGRVSLVRGFGKVLWPDRTTKSGEKFHVETPDWLCGFLEFENGAVARLTACFYVGPTKQHGIEFHGDAATLHLASAHDFDAAVQTRLFGTPEWVDEPLVKKASPGVEWARGLVELCDAIRQDRPQRATGEQAAHVVEVIAGVHKAAKTGKPVAMKSTFDRPEPMDWAR
jgi:predicted dehydrogenase